jgi:hypothetical protein
MITLLGQSVYACVRARVATTSHIFVRGDTMFDDVVSGH